MTRPHRGKAGTGVGSQRPGAAGEPGGRRPQAGEWGALHLGMLEQLGPPSVLVDGGGAIVHMSRSAGRFLRLAGGEPSHDLFQLVHPDLQEGLARALADAGAGGTECRCPPASVVLEGRPEGVAIRVVPMAEGGTRGFLVVFEPVGGMAQQLGEPGRLERDLRATGERFQLMVESAREYAIFSLDLERRVTSWNVGAERLLGYLESEILGRSADVIFTPQDRAAGAPEHEATQALREGRASDDRQHVRKDGTTFWARGFSMPMLDPQGRPVALLKILRDQTEARQAQQALERSQAELVQALGEAQRAREALEMADAAKDRFLAVLSHELRNPLASISSASELLMMPNLPPAALEKASMVVQRQARAMKVLLDELLDVSRLSPGRMSLSRTPVSIAAVVQSAIEMSRPLVQAAGHELVLSLPPQQVEVDGDPVRLAQVISNLVSNAAKYTPAGGRIAVSAELFHDEVVVTVVDDGIGMEPAEIDRMFDMFTQAEDARHRSQGGLGIGLALARNIVELHGGWIMASSAGLGQGTHLRVGLPILRVSDAEPAHNEAPRLQPQIAAPQPDGELILVADDNGDAAWGLAKLLELSGFQAVIARGGQEALAVAEQRRPAIALLDIGMPDLSGHEVARALRQLPWGRNMVLIAATGWGQESDVRLSMEAGFDAHLTKPLNVGRIRSLIDELAKKKG